MDNLPVSTTPPNLVNTFHRIVAYTNGYQIVVLGTPPELPEDDPLSHNCDAMGCGSLDHVVARIPVMQPTPELEWSGNADFDEQLL